MSEIRGLTLLQPWAGLVALGAKRIETRSWKNPYRGLVAIHAGRGRAADPLFVDVCAAAGYLAATAPPVIHARGAVVALARLADMMPTELTQPSVMECRLGDYTPGRWAWFLEDLRPLDDLVPCRGLQGLWPLPRDVDRALRAAAGI